MYFDINYFCVMISLKFCFDTLTAMEKYLYA